MKKEGRIDMFSQSNKYYFIALFLVLIVFFMYYFFFNFKTGDLVYKKNFNTLGEIVGISPLKLGYLVYWQNETYTNEFAFNLEKIDRIKEGTFEQMEEENETPWYALPASFENTNFSKTLYHELSREGMDDSDTIYEQIPAIPKVGICTPNLKCEAWSDCLINYNFESLINIDRIEGVEYKSCTDLNKCIPNIVGSRPCISKINITTRREVWCGKEYTEVIDRTGKVLARLDTKNYSNYLDISISLGENYCSYCYDKQKNYDETDIDCGGSCKVC